MSVILQPCASKAAAEHYLDTISNSNITIESIKNCLSDKQIKALYEYYPDGKLMAWGIKTGSKTGWDKVEEGDVVLFSAKKHVFASAVVGYKMHNRNLAQQLWGLDTDGNPWEYMYFLSDLHNVEISYEDFNKCVGYKENNVIQGFTVLDDEKSLKFLLKYPFGNERFSHAEKDIDNDNAKALLDGVDGTDEESIVKIRKEQSILRQGLFKGRKTAKCAICGREFPVEMLCCSHIKKRCFCNEEERKDLNVVVSMCKFGCDELFEKGFVGVDDGRVVVLKYSGNETVDDYLNFLKGKSPELYNDKNKKYFDYQLSYNNYLKNK